MREHWRKVNNAEADELWLKKIEQLFQVINVAVENNCIEPALILVYSGIDAMAWLNSPAGQEDVSRTDFLRWCEKYLLHPTADKNVTPLDLYAARCGLVHQHTADSKLYRKGEVTKLFYSRKTPAGEINFNQNKLEKTWPLWADVDILLQRFRAGVDAFRKDVADLAQREPYVAGVVYDRISNAYFVQVDVPDRDPLTHKAYDDESRYEEENRYHREELEEETRDED